MPEVSKCVYCGSDSDIAREHVIPASFLGRKSMDPKEQWIVDACSMCNTFAGSAVFFTIPEKAKYILKKYQTKYRKVLNLPRWKELDIAALNYRLQMGLRQKLLLQKLLRLRIYHLKAIARNQSDYLKPVWYNQRAADAPSVLGAVK